MNAEVSFESYQFSGFLRRLDKTTIGLTAPPATATSTIHADRSLNEIA